MQDSDATIFRMAGNSFGALLEAKGITQTAMAELLDVSVSSVNRWVSGESLPEPRTLVKICRTYSVSADWLLGLPAAAAADLNAVRLENARLRQQLLDVQAAATEFLQVVFGPQQGTKPTAVQPTIALQHQIRDLVLAEAAREGNEKAPTQPAQPEPKPEVVKPRRTTR